VRCCSRDGSAANTAFTRVIQELGDVIEAFPRSARRAWNDAVVRDFNIGVELAPGANSVELAIAADAVKRVATLGGRISFTAYAADRRPLQSGVAKLST
jgi:hypothetical protein